MLKRLVLLAALLLGACSTTPAVTDNLDTIATDYVKMTLVLGEREEGYVDAYYGPPEWLAAAKLDKRSVVELGNEATRLTTRLSALPPSTGLEARRRAFMLGQLKAAETRIAMMQGEKLSFQDEAEGLFGVRPELKPLASYDPVLARIDTLVPGTGPLSDRVDAFQNRFTIPKERLEPVFRAAIAECRRRTLARIPLPADEKFTLEFVTGKSWSGYNYYKGNATSLIQINTDLPIRISRAVDLGCHEGYPGHHVLNALLEQRLVRDRGWVEFAVYPLFSPQSLVAEGSANYGVDVAFPLAERMEFEKRVLFPLAGLDPSRAEQYYRVQRLGAKLTYAANDVARDYLDGRIDRAEAERRLVSRALSSPERARQRVRFFDTYRSYVINYNLGKDLVRAFVERRAGRDATPAAKWREFVSLLSSPRLPSGLK